MLLSLSGEGNEFCRESRGADLGSSWAACGWKEGGGQEERGLFLRSVEGNTPELTGKLECKVELFLSWLG